MYTILVPTEPLITHSANKLQIKPTHRILHLAE